MNLTSKLKPDGSHEFTVTISLMNLKELVRSADRKLHPLHDEPENDLIDEPIPTAPIQIHVYERLLARNEKLEAALDNYLRVIGTVKALPMPFTMAERLSEVQLRMLELKAARDG